MSVLEKDDKSIAPMVEELVALARAVPDPAWLDGSREEESPDEGECIIRAIAGMAHDPAYLQRWGIVKAMNQQTAARVNAHDLSWDEALWDETALLSPDWRSLLTALKARWQGWWQEQQQALEAGISAITQPMSPQWTARGQTIGFPLAFVAHVAPHMTNQGISFSLRENQPYALQLALPSPHHVALLQLDESPDQPPSLLYPTNQEQSLALGPGAVDLLRLRFPERGETQLVLLFSAVPFADIVADWPVLDPSQATWSEAEQRQITEGLLARVDDWSPQFLVLAVDP